MSLDQISAEGLDAQWESWAWSFVPAQRWIETVYWSLEVGWGAIDEKLLIRSVAGHTFY